VAQDALYQYPHGISGRQWVKFLHFTASLSHPSAAANTRLPTLHLLYVRSGTNGTNYTDASAANDSTILLRRQTSSLGSCAEVGVRSLALKLANKSEST